MNWLTEEPSIFPILFSSLKLIFATVVIEVRLRLRRGILPLLCSNMTKSYGLKPAVAKKILACLVLWVPLEMLDTWNH